MNIFDTLGFNDVEAGDVQSVDEMTIIPILGDERTENVSRPRNVNFRRTSDYGSMVFENADDDGYGVVPNNTMVISEKAAQDHAMSETGIVLAGDSKTFNNACCVQQSQGGYLDNVSDNDYNVLPMELRRALLSPSLRGQNSYDKLWGDIKRWLSPVPGISSGAGHLEYFFKPFANELEDFVAEFEPVEGQIGALVFFGNKPVGVELMPNTEHWTTYWKWLVRGCYGAQMLNMRKSGKLQASRLGLPALSSGNMIDEIEKYLSSLKGQLASQVDSLQISAPGGRIAAQSFGVKKSLIKVGQGGGDLVTEKNKPIYLSAVI